MNSKTLLEIELNTLWENDRITFFVETDLLAEWIAINGLNSEKIKTIFRDRGLDDNHFFKECSLVSNDIESKSAFLFKEILSKPYTSANNQLGANEHAAEGLARPFHGISHIVRSSIYLVVFVNLLKFLKSDVVLGIDNNDIQMLTDIVMMHDIARMGEGADEWELESAIFAFFYFIQRGYTVPEAKLMAEAIANKDSEDVYHSLTIENNDLSWAKYNVPKTGLVIDMPTFLMNVMNYSRQPTVWREFLGSTP